MYPYNFILIFKILNAFFNLFFIIYLKYGKLFNCIKKRPSAMKIVFRQTNITLINSHAFNRDCLTQYICMNS